MIPDIGGGVGAKLVTASVVVAIALLMFFLIVRAWRRRAHGSVPRGARNRGPRLGVLDSVAIDQRRRLVLVRRDDVEHLIMIGGPSDLVVESGIGAVPVAVAPSPPPAVGEPAGTSNAGLYRSPDDAAHRVSPAAASREPASVAEPAAPSRPTAATPVAVTGPVRDAPAVERSAPVPADQTARTEAGQPADIADLLDTHRRRVLGEREVQTPPVVRAYLDEDDIDELPPAAPRPVRSAPEARPPSSSVLRFEDFLDPEVAGDLSSVKPEVAPRTDAQRVAPAPMERASTGSVVAPPSRSDNTESRPDTALDDEMSRLLKHLSDKPEGSRT